MKIIFRTIRFKPIPCLIIAAIILLMLGCTNPNPDAPSSGSVHTKGWNNPELQDSNDFHGTQANQDGYDSCRVCHGKELTGTGTNHALGQDWLDKKSSQFHGSKPTDNCSDCHELNLTCNECHFGVSGSQAPLGSGWIHGLNDDHERYESDQSVCNRCHNLNRSYQNEPTSCHDCHDD